MWNKRRIPINIFLPEVNFSAESGVQRSTARSVSAGESFMTEKASTLIIKSGERSMRGPTRDIAVN